MSSKKEGVPMQRPCLSRIKKTQKYAFCEGTKRLAREHLLLCNNVRELHVRNRLSVKLHISCCLFFPETVGSSVFTGWFSGVIGI